MIVISPECFNVLTKYVTFLITEVYIYLNCAPGRFTGIEEKTTGIFLRGHRTSSKLQRF